MKVKVTRIPDTAAKFGQSASVAAAEVIRDRVRGGARTGTEHGPHWYPHPHFHFDMCWCTASFCNLGMQS
ncbi:unnamed protein product [Pleuronectes platessa]|uniref:Uncharacterized protein n=1 Tax=Pleuronectes platessa TaxID=8262 RepID=A0A9N7VZX8_PLEPL|nr:unnamed protein product [Pleuronectes platessa]